MISCEDGELPDDFKEWGRGVTCTTSPHLLNCLAPQRELRLNVTVRRTMSVVAIVSSYAPLYERARRFALARASRLACADPAALLRTWILAHAWFSHEFGPRRIISATVTLGVLFALERDQVPHGLDEPTSASLMAASGGSPESFAAKHLDDNGVRHLDELYVDFADADADGDVTISYGEYVPASEQVDFQPVIDRAEALAAFYRCLSDPHGTDGSDGSSFRSVRREWNRLSTGKTNEKHSTMAVVHLYMRRGGER